MVFYRVGGSYVIYKVSTNNVPENINASAVTSMRTCCILELLLSNHQFFY